MYLIVMFGQAFMGVDVWAVTFSTEDAARAWIEEHYGMSHEDIMQTHDLLQDWMDGNFHDECPIDEARARRIFADDEQDDWDAMLESQQMQMPYGFYHMEEGLSRMVIGQGSFM